MTVLAAGGEEAELARGAGEGGAADPVEGLVAGLGGVGVDAGQVDLVRPWAKSVITSRAEKPTRLSLTVLKSKVSWPPPPV